MIGDQEARSEIAAAVGKSVADLVRERMRGLVEEPDITSRVGQRLEDKYDGQTIAGYRIKVITETMTSHGKGSLENPTGTDLYMALSVQDQNGRETSKGVLIQAKRSDKCKWPDLEEQCRRMNLITKKGSVIWLYDKHGIDVIKSENVKRRRSASFDIKEFFDEVFACNVGDQRKVPTGTFGDRPALREMLRALGARNAVWLDLEKSGRKSP